MASISLNKGTRKTYSFEEREILVNLIYKYLNGNDEDKNSETGSNSKRKSVWFQLTEEYNTLVGPSNSRSSIQLRRCWENMKANKKNRDDKRVSEKVMNEKLQPTPSSSIGLPPNVVFQPKDSEPFTLEGLIPPTFQTHNIKKDEELNGDLEEEKINDHESVSVHELSFDVDDVPPKKMKRKTISPKKQIKQKIQKSNKIQKNSELYEFAISEAQLKLDTASLLKEEAKLKLEEAEYRKEEARMRMICITYKLQKLREECEDVLKEEEEK
ncbi:PREDICTED: myb/SANT-like DNA-binding domain-containing protein 3 [Ceratosolen solmsi marchali]|uniref:Regulatory protein zeste n=1 Tax=Ceratosolen solmsi marchali TaxID=326594 RepID=A0AAJ6YTT1_9HYME|nr:PREDICTED: myb/SANT-like DNA-binding domain-containing protein 3 [Ceratosolen solmsi marchali]